ncbi:MULTISPECIES: RNA ligase family protein [Paenibacillus]|uniref:DNA ligase (ATP) n=1 Tax=Paenibacillus violae TaxID=3077234 RepID=A0ABU3RHA3_9BACL|nr:MULTISPECIES: RNA ligase family protein [Paenibacillus]MDU0203665.1 RNA ligase family protein [Paenibacillus sp. PFR10]MEC0271138.1 RNA ligase family protein [Paenibacillus anseongense]
MELTPVIPFEPISTEALPESGDWVAQIKWDGVRMLTYFDGNEVRLINRRLNDRTMQYPEIANISTYCKAKSVILDGEIIALKDGKPSFHEIMRRDGVRNSKNIPQLLKTVPVVYMIFDILFHDGQWVVEQPLQQRQQLLSKVVSTSEMIQVVPNHSDPASLYAVMEQHDMEGIVLKDLNSKYQLNGKDKRWMKKKIIHDLVAVVGGVTKRGKLVNAVMLGLYDDAGQLWYIGHAGTGKLTQSDWRSLTEVTDKMVLDKKPFFNTPERSKEAIWIQPLITVKINYMAWTRERNLRQPSIQAIVSVSPEECNFSQL